MRHRFVIQRRFAIIAPLTLAFLVAVAILPAAGAEGLGSVDIHGFGAWVYTRTDGNAALSGDEQGRWDRANLALNVSAQPADRLAFRSQFELLLGGEELETELDFVFAEWTFADALRFRIGKIQQPFGIYTEIFDVGTVRPFYDLPQSIYGAAGVVSEGVTGIGLRGSVPVPGGWELNYDLYGGELEAGQSQPWSGLVTLEGVESEEMDIQDTVGGRLVAVTPVAGLSFGASAYTGVNDKEEQGDESVRSVTLGAHAEYLAGPVLLRAEYATMDYGDILAHSGWYAEGGYMITRNLQAVAKYEASKTTLDGIELGEDDNLLEHRGWAVGLNWWFSNNFVVKLSYQRVDGLRFIGEGDSEGDDETTGIIQFGGQFSF